jgi:hypothetical protein
MELTINPAFGQGTATLPLSHSWRVKQRSPASEWVQVNRGPTSGRCLIRIPANHPIARAQVPAVDNVTEQIFEGLRQKWEMETAIDSSIAKKSMHPAYQRIIGMGPDVLPLILRDLRNRQAHWFWALHAITGDDPAQNQSTVDGAVNAWIRWGKGRGLI